MDFFAVASIGFYPTPTPTNRARAAFVATYGLINIGAGSLPGGGVSRGLIQLGMSLTTT
jgi:hypothetical protein